LVNFFKLFIFKIFFKNLCWYAKKNINNNMIIITK
jgi:hypothetical protein